MESKMNTKTEHDREFAAKKRRWHGMADVNSKLLFGALIMSISLFAGKAWGSGSTHDVSAHAEATNIAKIVSSWIEPCQKRIGVKTEREDED